MTVPQEVRSYLGTEAGKAYCRDFVREDYSRGANCKHKHATVQQLLGLAVAARGSTLPT